MAICVDIVPTPCGGTNKLTMKDACNDVHFTGIEDTTINQGVGIDLTEGIHAYDGNGNEIEYTVTPDSIDKCDVGEHTVVYRTIGEGDKFLPSFCMDNVDVTLGDTFCNEILLEEDRIVTITQADPPTIEGIETIPTIYPNEEFDPTEGITATDDNGKTIDFTYSGRVEDSSEGAIASFETEFEQNALSVVADIEPIQDLHGYDKPWSGGAGKNKFDASHDFLKVENGITFTLNNDGSVTANGTATSQCQCYWRISKETAQTFGGLKISCGRTDVDCLLELAGSPYTQYANINTDDGLVADTISSISLNANFIIRIFSGTTFNNVKLYPMIRTASTDSTWQPYSNICPISGHDEVNVSVCGVNVWDEEWEVGGIDEDGQKYVATDIIRTKNYISVVGGTTYYCGSSNVIYKIWCYDADKNFISSILNTSGIVTVPTNCAYIMFRCKAGYGTTYNNDISINYPSTDTSYHAYNGTTYEVSFGTAGTVYGGTVDVVSGVLTVTMAIVDLGTLDWTHDSQSNRFYTTGISELVKRPSDNYGVADSICSAYSVTSLNQFWNSTDGKYAISITGAVSIRDSKYADATDFKTAMDGVQLCYELATPTTVQLTAQEVELLLGQNNVWADTGDIKVIYEKEMPASGNIEYLTAGFKIITYTATDECGNQTVEQRIVYVLGDTPQVCMAEVCTAHVACEDNQ